jgi:hypothetical protein
MEPFWYSLDCWRTVTVWMAGFNVRIVPASNGLDAIYLALLNLPFIFLSVMCTHIFLQKLKETKAAFLSGGKALAVHILRVTITAILDTMAQGFQFVLVASIVWGSTYKLWPIQPGRDSQSSSPSADIVLQLVESLGRPLWWLNVFITGIAVPLIAEITAYAYHVSLLQFYVKKSVSASHKSQAGKASRVHPSEISKHPDARGTGNATHERMNIVERTDSVAKPRIDLDAIAGRRAFRDQLLSEYLGPESTRQPISAAESHFYCEISVRSLLLQEHPEFLAGDQKARKCSDPTLDPRIPPQIALALATKNHVTAHSTFVSTSISSSLQLVSLFLMVSHPSNFSFWYGFKVSTTISSCCYNFSC